MCSDLASFPLVNQLSSLTITSQASPVVCPEGGDGGDMSKGGSGCDGRGREGGMRLRWMNNTYLPAASHVPALTRAAWESGQESRRFGGWCQAEGGVVITLVIV